VDSVSLTDVGNLAMWKFKLVSGAVIGDWKTSLKNLSGAGGTGGGSFSSGGGGGVCMVTFDVPPPLSDSDLATVPVNIYLSNRYVAPVGFTVASVLGNVGPWWLNPSSPAGALYVEIDLTSDQGKTWRLLCTLVIPEGGTADYTQSTFANSTVAKGDGFRIKLLAGSAQSAQAFHVEVWGS
jgi:hypothetical protein